MWDYSVKLQWAVIVKYGGCMGRILWNLLWKVLPWVLVLILLIRPTIDATNGIGRFLTPFMPVQPQQAMPLNPIVSNPATQMLDEQTIVRQMNDISRLETQSALIDTTFTLTNDEARSNWSWWSGEMLMMRAVGTVIAGVDLADMSVNDITVSDDGRMVRMTLAEVKILSLTMDQAQTQPLSYKKGLGLIFDDSIQMTEQAYAMAHENILRKACSTGMMEKAADNNKMQLTQLIKAMNPAVTRVDITVQAGDCLTVAQ
jgi:hypothetical protein